MAAPAVVSAVSAVAPAVRPDLAFGRFRLSFEQRVLLVDGEPARLGPRAMDVLLALAARPERAVSKNELLDIVWPTVVVEENNLQVHIWALRKLLGPEAITTIAGRGYRFTAVAAGAAAPAEARTAGADPTAELQLRYPLPPRLPELIGREDDLAALARLLDRHSLVTIAGAGGIGKTRLAQHVLQQRRAALTHGVGWVELAGLSDAALLAGSIAAALGLQGGDRDPVDGLVAALRPLRALVVLDNAEHLVADVAQLVRALHAGAPDLQLLVTSQMPLKLAGERVYRLGPLAVPEAAVPLAEAAEYGAVHLFVQRAQAVERRFELSADNLPTVVEICARLDGVALAIELAAARVPLLGLARVAAALDARLRLLTDGDRGAPARQQTLRAALEWSHALLDAAEQQVFRRLGVFAGGFTLELAQAVLCGAGAALDPWEVLDIVGALVDRSLVTADAGEPPRYRLLESARAYALERLAAAGEDAALRGCHARAIHDHLLAVEAGSWSGRLAYDAACAALASELDNAREALAWALAHDHALALSMAPALDLALTRDGRPEARQVWDATAALDRSALPPSLRARWAGGCASFLSLHRPAASLDLAQEARALHRQLGDAPGEYLALAVEVQYRDGPGAPDRSQRDRLAELRALEQPAWSARVRYHGARAEYFLELFCEDFDAAGAAARRMLALAQSAGDTASANAALVNLADLALSAGRAAEASRYGTELLRRLRGNTRHQSNLAFARLNLVAAWLAQDALPQARAEAELGWPMATWFDLQDSWADCLALLAVLEGRPRCAARLRGYAETAYAASGFIPEVNELRMARRGEALTRAALDEADLERLRAEGRLLRAQDVAAVAFAPVDL